MYKGSPDASTNPDPYSTTNANASTGANAVSTNANSMPTNANPMSTNRSTTTTVWLWWTSNDAAMANTEYGSTMVRIHDVTNGRNANGCAKLEYARIYKRM